MKVGDLVRYKISYGRDIYAGIGIVVAPRIFLTRDVVVQFITGQRVRCCFDDLEVISESR